MVGLLESAATCKSPLRGRGTWRRGLGMGMGWGWQCGMAAGAGRAGTGAHDLGCQGPGLAGWGKHRRCRSAAAGAAGAHPGWHLLADTACRCAWRGGGAASDRNPKAAQPYARMHNPLPRSPPTAACWARRCTTTPSAASGPSRSHTAGPSCSRWVWVGGRGWCGWLLRVRASRVSTCARELSWRRRAGSARVTQDCDELRAPLRTLHMRPPPAAHAPAARCSTTWLWTWRLATTCWTTSLSWAWAGRTHCARCCAGRAGTWGPS